MFVGVESIPQVDVKVSKIIYFIFLINFRGIEALQYEGNQSADWAKVDLFEVLKLMKDLIDYFAQPADDLGKLSQKMNKDVNGGKFQTLKIDKIAFALCAPVRICSRRKVF